jgi:NitT/TauT family transport system substrate-binding protein
MTGFRRAAVIGAAIVGLGALSLPASAQVAPLTPVRTVKVATVGQASDAALYIALEKGYFKELGLNVELVLFQSAATMIAPLGSGELDVGGGAISAGLWNAQVRDLGIRAVADKGSTRDGFSYFALVVKKDSPIKECKDMKGKTLANASTSNGILHAIEIWLKTCGLTLKDMNVKPMGYPDVVPALQNGAIDVGHLGEPLIALNEANGLIRVLKRHSELRPTEQIAVLYYSAKFQKDKEASNRFMLAYVRAAKDYQDAYAKGLPPQDWYIDVMTKHTRVKDRALYSKAVPAGLDLWGEMNMKTMRDDFEWFKAQGLIISKDAKFEDPFDMSYLKYAKDQLQKK